MMGRRDGWPFAVALGGGNEQRSSAAAVRVAGGREQGGRAACERVATRQCEDMLLYSEHVCL